jgi:hypothetical protein
LDAPTFLNVQATLAGELCSSIGYIAEQKVRALQSNTSGLRHTCRAQRTVFWMRRSVAAYKWGREGLDGRS